MYFPFSPSHVHLRFSLAAASAVTSKLGKLDRSLLCCFWLLHNYLHGLHMTMHTPGRFMLGRRVDEKQRRLTWHTQCQPADEASKVTVYTPSTIVIIISGKTNFLKRHDGRHRLF